MMNVQIFKNQQFGQIRTVAESGKILFCGSDIARALGYARPNEAVAAHAKGTVNGVPLPMVVNKKWFLSPKVTCIVL